MVFSQKIIKLGKAERINGIAKRDKVKLYFSKNGNKVFQKSIKLTPRVKLIDVSDAVNYSEIIPLNDQVVVKRLGENLWVNINE